MTLRTLALTIVTVTLFSCNFSDSNLARPKQIDQSNVNHASDTSAVAAIDTVVTGQKQYTFIAGISQKGDSTFMDADYIQYLTGELAIEAAEKAHQADTFQTEDGVTHVDVPNDYYIVNANKKIRHLPIAKNCVFDLIINPDRLHPINNSSLQSLQKIYGDSPFILTLDDHNVVIKIKEVFTP
jgi:hypothetical protein